MVKELVHGGNYLFQLPRLELELMEIKRVILGIIAIFVGLGLLRMAVIAYPAPTLLANLLLVIIFSAGIVLIGLGAEHASGRRIPLPKPLRSAITILIMLVFGIILAIGCGAVAFYLIFIYPIHKVMMWIVVLLGLGCLLGFSLLYEAAQKLMSRSKHKK